FRAAWPSFEEQITKGLQEDETAWGGWYARHGGALEHLGDRVAGESGSGTDVATGAFLALFAGCIWLFTRQAIAAPRPVSATAARPRKGAHASAKSRR
ncbi:MAG TPA: hypothetical protein VL285_10370, partial [Bryobacteraceae bacterium]|nr:hypothetical protein [Bryobacteraceae bacterium]